MRVLTFLIFVVAFDAVFPFYLELKPITESILENQTIVKPSKSDTDAWRRRLLNNLTTDIKNKDYPEFSWGRRHDFPGENEKSEPDMIGSVNQEDQSAHFPRDIRQDIRYYPGDWLAAWKNAAGMKLLKKTSTQPEAKLDDSVPFWAARG